MFHSHGKNNKINWFHENCLQIIYSNKNPPLLNYWKRIILSQLTKLVFVIETFTFNRSLAPALCKNILPQNRQNRYELRNNADFTLPMVKSVHKVLESLS